MLLENNTITVSKSAVKYYGGLGAIILQELYTEYGGRIKIDVPKWREDCLGYIPQKTIKRVLTTLRNDGKIKMDDVFLYIEEGERKQTTIFDKGVSKPEQKKRDNPTWDMAVLLCKLVGQPENMMTPNRYLKFAKQLLEAKKTEGYMIARYGEGGLWYQHEFKGQKGSHPNLQDIRKTLDKDYSNIDEETKDVIKTAWTN